MSEKKLILVVDDEYDLREILREEFEYSGYAVVEAENGKRAIEVLNAHPVDVVLSDIRMPGGNGLDFLHYVAQREGARPPVILVSAFADIDIGDAEVKGAFAFVSKPYDLQDLMAIIEKAVSESDRREILRRAAPEELRISMH
jgi:DNA-binding NtrC family response regulator